MFRCSRRVLNFLIRTNDNVSLNRLFSRGRNECDRCQSLRFQGNGLVAQEVGECKDGLRVVDYETEIGRFTTEILDTFRFDGASKCYRKILRISYKDCYQRGSPCQDPAGNRTTRRSHDHRKETQTAVVWSCLPFIIIISSLTARIVGAPQMSLQPVFSSPVHQVWPKPFCKAQ